MSFAESSAYKNKLVEISHLDLTYEQIIEILGDIKCFNPTTHGRFFIRGTKYYLQARFIPDIFKEPYTMLAWVFLNKKAKKKRVLISLEDVLSTQDISKKAKRELIFYLDLFLPRAPT